VTGKRKRKSHYTSYIKKTQNAKKMTMLPDDNFTSMANTCTECSSMNRNHQAILLNNVGVTALETGNVVRAFEILTKASGLAQHYYSSTNPTVHVDSPSHFTNIAGLIALLTLFVL
jgi:hypothetical protein